MAPFVLSVPSAPVRPAAGRHRAMGVGAVLALAVACALTACDKLPKPQQVPTPTAEAPEAAAAPLAARYTPPSADTLYQMVAPIALYPDRLVAQILAGATYPEQITAAETWLGQNPSLKARALADAADRQPWDPSVKSLTAFPNVLEQMASNLPWTVALGQAYYNDPADVMNAIQVMRSRARQAGTLQSSQRLRVATAARLPTPALFPGPAVQPPVVYSGPAVVPAPATYITIEPADVQTVYVPSYNPQVVYGTPVALYPHYRWAAPAVAVASPMVGVDPLVVGALAFGAGVIVGAAAVHPSWGWEAWGVNWGAPPPAIVAWGAPPPPRPSVIYQGNTYISHSATVVQNIHNTVTVNQFARDAGHAVPAALPALAGAMVSGRPAAPAMPSAPAWAGLAPVPPSMAEAQRWAMPSRAAHEHAAAAANKPAAGPAPVPVGAPGLRMASGLAQRPAEHLPMPLQETQRRAEIAHMPPPAVVSSPVAARPAGEPPHERHALPVPPMMPAQGLLRQATARLLQPLPEPQGHAPGIALGEQGGGRPGAVGRVQPPRMVLPPPPQMPPLVRHMEAQAVHAPAMAQARPEPRPWPPQHPTPAPREQGAAHHPGPGGPEGHRRSQG